MLPVLLKLKQGGKTHKELLSSGTEKFVYVLEGQVNVIVGKAKNSLSKGATLYFDASLPHYIQNIGKEEASCICVVTPTTL